MKEQRSCRLFFACCAFSLFADCPTPPPHLTQGPFDLVISRVSKPLCLPDLNQSEAGQGGLLVCGSFYLMPETRATLGIPQEMDPVKLGEQYTMKLGSPTPSAASKP